MRRRRSYLLSAAMLASLAGAAPVRAEEADTKPAATAAPVQAPAKAEAPAKEQAPAKKQAPKPAAPAPAEAPPQVFFSPFGPPWDPTRPPPQAPKPHGRGITAAKLIAAGNPEIEQMRGKPSAGPLSVVALDIAIAADSVTVPLRAASVTAKLDDGESAPLHAVCTPSADTTSFNYHGAGYTLATWNVAVAGHIWICADHNARLVVRVGEGGIQLMTQKNEWKGPLLLFFLVEAERLREVTLPGAKVRIPARDEDAAGPKR